MLQTRQRILQSPLAEIPEREKFIIRQPPIGEKDDYDIVNPQLLANWIGKKLSKRYV